jgi:hypothetical protein
MGPDYDFRFHRVESAGSRPCCLCKRRFLDDIRSGAKTQTIRLWKHRMTRSGQRSYIPGVEPIRITTVEPVHVDALTDADAIPDRFKTAAALQKELLSILWRATLRRASCVPSDHSRRRGVTPFVGGALIPIALTFERQTFIECPASIGVRDASHVALR